jgi:hypothetical protein
MAIASVGLVAVMLRSDHGFWFGMWLVVIDATADTVWFSSQHDIPRAILSAIIAIVFGIALRNHYGPSVPPTDNQE